MNIANIYDKTSSQGLLCGWGFSFLINEKILFDTGEKGESLLYNLKEMGYSSKSLEAVVLSHDHWDHWGGLEDLLSEHPGLPVYVPQGISDELINSIDSWGGKLKVGDAGLELIPGCYLSGTVYGEYKGKTMNEQTLLMKTPSGVSVLTGCAHPGIVKMVDASISLFTGESLNTLIGGFHLYRDEDKSVDAIIDELRARGFKTILATHCSGEHAEALSDQKIFAGWCGDL